MVLTLWVGVLAYRERRRWLMTWAGVYFTVAITMTSLTYSKGPDPHDMFGCRWAAASTAALSMDHGCGITDLA